MKKLTTGYLNSGQPGIEHVDPVSARIVDPNHACYGRSGVLTGRILKMPDRVVLHDFEFSDRYDGCSGCWLELNQITRTDRQFNRAP